PSRRLRTRPWRRATGASGRSPAKARYGSGATTKRASNRFPCESLIGKAAVNQTFAVRGHVSQSMTDTDAIDLASMLCSRLCHDMLSPVGALSNGLELLAGEKDPEMRQRCFELLEQSAQISADKLKFFRLAYGAAG